MRLILTPKAFANLSPGLERSDNPGSAIQKHFETLKAFANKKAQKGSIDQYELFGRFVSVCVKLK